MKNKKNKKKIISIVALAASFVLCIGATFGITLAYFGGNSGSVGLGDVTLKTGLTIGATAAAENTNVLVVPGQAVSINSEATISAYTGNETADASQAVPGIVRAKFSIGNDLGTVTIAGSGSDYWTLGDDGYYYLVTADKGTALKKVAAGDKATIVASFVVPDTYGNDKSGTTMTVSVIFEVAQGILYNGTSTAIADSEYTVANANTSTHVVYKAFDAIKYTPAA